MHVPSLSPSIYHPVFLPFSLSLLRSCLSRLVYFLFSTFSRSLSTLQNIQWSTALYYKELPYQDLNVRLYVSQLPPGDPTRDPQASENLRHDGMVHGSLNSVRLHRSFNLYMLFASRSIFTPYFICPRKTKKLSLRDC